MMYKKRENHFEQRSRQFGQAMSAVALLGSDEHAACQSGPAISPSSYWKIAVMYQVRISKNSDLAEFSWH